MFTTMLYKILHQGNGVFKCNSKGSHKWTRNGQQLGLNSNYVVYYSRISWVNAIFRSFVNGAVLIGAYIKGLFSSWKITRIKKQKQKQTRPNVVHYCRHNAIHFKNFNVSVSNFHLYTYRMPHYTYFKNKIWKHLLQFK